jgi:glycosyltransferase involved in cell wall biosynthesis
MDCAKGPTVRIVFLTPSAQGGGAEAALCELMHALREARPDWSLHLISAEGGPLLSRIAELTVPCEVLAFPSALRSLGEKRDDANWTLFGWLGYTVRLARGAISAIGYRQKLRRRLHELRPTIVHSNGMKMHLLAALAKSPSSLDPVIVWHLHDYLSARRVMSAALRLFARRCDAIVANSHSVALDAAKVMPSSLRIEVIYNAVDIDSFRPNGDRLDLDTLAGLSSPQSGTIRVGLVATFAKWKGHEMFLRAAAAVPAARPIRFYVIGGPIYATSGSQWQIDELRGMAAALHLDSRIGFTGFVAEAASALRALDIVVHASTEPEPFGLVIIQAMACGRALISSAGGGAQELIEPNVDAMTYSATDPAALASMIERLAGDADLRARLGTAGSAKVRTNFSRHALAQNAAPFYASLSS